MAGIGKYKKGAKFMLKSGNNPSFQQMRSGNTDNGPLYKVEEAIKEEKVVKTPDKPGTKAWKIAANALIGGFDAITGMKTKRPRINFGQHEKEVKAESPELKGGTIISDILGEDYQLGDLSKKETTPKYSLTKDYKKPKTNIKGSLS